MESAYGIGTKNRYALFYDDEQDPVEVIKAKDAEREKKKQKQVQDKENKSKVTSSNQKPKQPVVVKKPTKDVPPTKPQEITPKKEVPATETNNKIRSPSAPVDQQRNVKFNSVPARERGERGDREPRGDRNDSRGPPPSMEERKNRRNWEETSGGGGGGGFPATEFNRDQSGSDRRFRGRGGGAMRGGTTRGASMGLSGGRGGLGRGGFDTRGKREYDRHSGSDKSTVKGNDKRDGSGAHNWGNIRDEVDDQMNSSSAPMESSDWAESADMADTETANKTEGGVPPTSDDPATEEPKIEEPKEMTLDEWKKEQEKNRFVPQFNLRKAGEGEDNSQWKKTYVLQKKKEEENAEGEGEEEAEEDEEDHVSRGRKKQVVDIEINFVDSRRGRGRGRGRGGPGDRGGPGGRGGGGPGGRGGGGGGRGGLSGDENPGERGGRGGGGARVGGPTPRTQSKQQAPRVDDEKDFPALG